MRSLSTIPANAFTISAVAIGALLTDDLTPAEQNSLGNWFMLIGQYLATNGSQQQVVNNGNNTSTNSNQHIVNSNAVPSQNELMRKVVRAINQQIDNMQ